MTLNSGTLQLTGIAAAASASLNSLAVNGNGALVVNASAGGITTLNFTGSNPITRTAGGTLVITPATGSLGTNEVISFATAPATPGGIVAPYIVVQTSDSNSAADFAAVRGNNLVVATYSGLLPAAGGVNSGVYQALANTTLTTSESAYALKVLPGVTVTATGQTLNLGNGTGQAGLILNGNASLSGGTLALGAAEGVVYAGGIAGSTISSAISGSGGLTVFGPQTLTLSGTNSYSGGTNINSSLSISSDGNLGSPPAGRWPSTAVR